MLFMLQHLDTICLRQISSFYTDKALTTETLLTEIVFLIIDFYIVDYYRLL